MPKQITLDAYFGVKTQEKRKDSPTRSDSFLAIKKGKRETEPIISKKRTIDAVGNDGHARATLERSRLDSDGKFCRLGIDGDASGCALKAANLHSIPAGLKETNYSLVQNAGFDICDENEKYIEEATKVTSSQALKLESKIEADRGSGSDGTLLSAVTAKGTDAKLTSTNDGSSPTSPLYCQLCEAFEAIESVTGRVHKQEIVTALFRQQIDSGKVESLYSLMYLSSNSVAPAYECMELGIGDAVLIKAIGEAYGTGTQAVKKRYHDEGDLGIVAQVFKGKQRTLGGFFAPAKPVAKKQWTCSEILSIFREIADMKGNQSQKLKTEKIKKMLVGATNALEPKFIVRALQGKLRIGLAESTLLISLAHALVLSVPPRVAERVKQLKDNKTDKYPEEAQVYAKGTTTREKRLEAAVTIVKKAYSELPSYDALLDAALSVPLQALHTECSLTPGIPVSPMLAKPTRSISEVLKRMTGALTMEFKYDGERAQVHMLPDGTTKVFSRNLLDTTEKYPEVPLFVKEAAGEEVKSFVCDAEVVAYDAEKGKLVPFQVLSTRKKTEESAETATVQVIVQAFDLMYLNGHSLLRRTLRERRSLLHKHFSIVQGKFSFANSLDQEDDEDCGDTAAIEDFLDLAIKGQCEGLMVKSLDVNAIYEPSRRSLNWLKLKKDYLQGLGDSVDLVPIGAYYGKGKRTGVYGAYLLACYDPDAEEFQSVCKIGTGFSDNDLMFLTESLNKSTILRKMSQYNVSDQLECDVWFDTVQVWEIRAADLSLSSTHRGGVGKTGEEGRGIGLRFPRFERVREDKKPEDATTSEQLLDMYYNQDSVLGVGRVDAGMDGGI